MIKHEVRRPDLDRLHAPLLATAANGESREARAFQLRSALLFAFSFLNVLPYQVASPTAPTRCDFTPARPPIRLQRPSARPPDVRHHDRAAGEGTRRQCAPAGPPVYAAERCAPRRLHALGCHGPPLAPPPHRLLRRRLRAGRGIPKLAPLPLRLGRARGPRVGARHRERLRLRGGGALARRPGRRAQGGRAHVAGERHSRVTRTPTPATH
jgi:hypothetical protein